MSGQDCPLTGVWRTLDAPVPPLLVRQGEIMPGAGGRIVSWEFVQPDESALVPAAID